MEGLATICSGLGIVEDDGYKRDEYCLENLKDLLRFLRRDDPQSRDVFKQVCKWNVVGKYLIPAIEYCQNDRNLVLNAVKVLAFLTMPIEPSSTDVPQQIEYLWQLKSSITTSDVVAVIVSLLETPLQNLECETFTEGDWKLVQLVLTLFRNLLAVQDILVQQKALGMATQYLSLRDRFLELLFQENVMDLILVLSQQAGGSCGHLRQDNQLLLETFHFIFIGQEPELIAKAYVKGSKVDGDAETSAGSLRSIMEEEQAKRKLARVRNLGCHSQFSGTFTRLAMNGSKSLIKGNPCSASHDNLFKTHKIHRGPSKRMVWDQGRLPSTKDNLLELLHDFINQFLSGAYNVLMQSIREDIEKEHHAIQKSDIYIFFEVVRFVTSFQYHKFLILRPNIEVCFSDASINHQADSTLFNGSMCGPIAASMNESMFLQVILKWRNAFDGLKETNDHKFLSIAGSLMKIMIRMLDLVLKQSPEDSKESQTARILLYKLFYDQTDEGMTQFLLNLIKSFDIHKQAKSDLADLVEMIHVVIRLMESLQLHGSLRVTRKSRKRRTKKTQPSDVDGTIGDPGIIQNEVGDSGCQQCVDPSMSKDETSASPVCHGNVKEDIITPVQVNEPGTSELETTKPGSNIHEMETKRSDNENDDLCYGTDDSSGDEQLVVKNEVDFNVSSVVSALANNATIQNICWLLKFYKSNTINTNHHVICMLRRICDDLELSPMLYKLSLLTTFYNILLEQKSSPCKQYENIVVFLTSLVRRMLRKMKSCPLLFVEVLFLKTRNECHYINCESILNDFSNLKTDGRKQGRSGDAEIGSSEGNGWSHRGIADALGDDEADFVISNGMVGQKEQSCEAKGLEVSKTSNGNIGEGKETISSISNNVIDGKEITYNEERHSVEYASERLCKRPKPLILNEELEGRIKDLYERYKDSQHCCHVIAEALDPDGKVSPLQVVKQLKRLRLKVQTTKGRLCAGGSYEVGEEERPLQSEVACPSLNDMEESSSQIQPFHTRKRVRAFSEDQELMIKTLFEQFKNHKRCSYMIANALDSSGKFLVAQISRKLKQLGLHVPKRKRLANLHLRDEDLHNSFTECADDSDDETLLYLRRKKRKNQSGSEERSNQNAGGKLSKDDSDDELLSCVLKKNKELPSKDDACESTNYFN